MTTGDSFRQQLVFTVKDRCRVCYTCLRECPAKAIKIINGQAEVIHERCIGCGNCVKVCSQDAKVYLKTVDEALRLLESDHKVAACLAPSFAAEFTELKSPEILVGMLHQMGFDYVTEVAFGADMVAREYQHLLTSHQDGTLITSDCPAIVYFIEHYHPNLVPQLAPIVSPMIAMTRIVREKYGEDCKTVFIGPCIAKKAESEEVDIVLTFREIREMFDLKGIRPENTIPTPFDPPYGGRGALFPISGGLLQTSQLDSELAEGDILLAEGRINIRDAIKEFEEGLVQTRHMELLCCEGCIMGAGMSPNGKKYSRRNHLTHYVHDKVKSMDLAAMDAQVEAFAHLDYQRQFTSKDRRLSMPSDESIDKTMHSMGKFTATDLLNCGACGYDTCIEHAIAIIQGLAENEMCLPHTIEKLHNYIKELNISNEKLATTQLALQQSEKLASLGQLSAGIAHELNNPLGVITMYSNIILDESRDDSPLRDDLKLIVEQADRCKKIVGGLLNFARKNKVNLKKIDIRMLLDHSLSSVLIPEDINIEVNLNTSDLSTWLDFDQMAQVFINLMKNSVDAMPQGGRLSIDIESTPDDFIFTFSDTGTGIPETDMDKVFTPFFTTKGLGKGTGLGLPIIYGIVKMHKGNVTLTSNADKSKGPTGTSFRITLPRLSDETTNGI